MWNELTVGYHEVSPSNSDVSVAGELAGSAARVPLLSLINAAFILPRWGKMEAGQKDRWYFVVLLFLLFLEGMGLIYFPFFFKFQKRLHFEYENTFIGIH